MYLIKVCVSYSSPLFFIQKSPLQQTSDDFYNLSSVFRTCGDGHMKWNLVTKQWTFFLSKNKSRWPSEEDKCILSSQYHLPESLPRFVTLNLQFHEFATSYFWICILGGSVHTLLYILQIIYAWKNIVRIQN